MAGSHFLLLCTTALNLVIPYIICQAIDVGLSKGEVRFLTKAAALILAIGIVWAIFPLGHRYLSEWIAAKIGDGLPR